MTRFSERIRDVGSAMLTLLAAMALVTVGALSWTNAMAEIELTPHNLGTTGPGPNTFSGTAEICVFCHTPHAGATGASVPLWNRNISAATYTTYSTLNTSTMDGEEAPVGSVSIACLSCHDGTQAMNVVLNEPNSGFTGTWTGNDRPTGDALISTDLTNDHPIGIQYGGGGITDGAPTAATNDPDFNAPGNVVLNGTRVWWVDSEATPNGTREKTDMLLYSRSVTGIDGGALQPFVECGSCHDPHVNNPTFLRVQNDGSAVCAACHNK